MELDEKLLARSAKAVREQTPYMAWTGEYASREEITAQENEESVEIARAAIEAYLDGAPIMVRETDEWAPGLGPGPIVTIPRGTYALARVAGSSENQRSRKKEENISETRWPTEDWEG